MRIDKTLEQITSLVKGSTSLDQSFFVASIASLDDAGPDDIAVLIDRGDASVFSDVAREKIEQCKAGLILAREAVVPGKNYLIVDDPLAAYQTLVAAAASDAKQPTLNADYPHAYVSRDATIGNGVVIGSGAVIEHGAQIGDGARIQAQTFVGVDASIGAGALLHPGVKVLARCVIGAQTIVHANTVIGSDGFGYSVGRAGMRKIPQIGIVRVGAHAEIGANCSIDRAAFGQTRIGNGCKLDNNIHIAHGVDVGDYTAILAQTGIAGSVVIGAGCQIGGHVAIKDHVTIGSGAKIVSKSAVLKDVPAGQTVGGMPAMDFRQYKRMLVAMLKLPELFKKAKELEKVMQRRTKRFWWW